MAGLTPQGLVIKTLPEVITSMGDKLKARYGSSFSVDVNTPEGVIIGIAADEISDLWEGLQGVYDSSYPKSAVEINLDNVADIVNVKRIPASQSTTSLEVTGVVGSTIPQGSVVTVTDTNERFLTTSALTLQSTRFSDLILEVTAIVDSTVYSVTIDNTVVSINSGVGATANSILTLLKTAIDTASLGTTTSLPTTTTLRINVTENNSVLPLVVGARLGITSISDLVVVEAQNTGVVKAPAGTLVTLLVPAVGVTSVNNLEDADEGREEETDEELRVRRYESVGIIGASTESAITSNVKNIEGVTAAFIIANRTFVTDSDGRPPKSFETVVEGGDEQEIAETIWKYHPVGIETYGDITRTIIDDNGDPQTVKFSRPEEIFVRMEIDYTKYDEEVFAASGEEGIKQAALAYGNSLNIGVDVIPQRFFGAIFSSVQGISSLVIRVSTSTDNITWTPYTTSPVPIGRKQKAVFDIDQIFPNEV